MMHCKNIITSTAFLLVAALIIGCAAKYQVQVNAYTDRTTPVPVPLGGSFFVIENQEAANPLLEKEIKAKINHLLVQRGYRLAPYEQAQYYLLFTYGIGSSAGASVDMPSYSVGFGIGYGYYSPRSYFFFWPGYITSPGYVDPLYDRWLLINVVEGKHFRDAGQFSALWVGETRSTGTSSDIREVINSLLLATFAQFGQNTGKAVKMDIKKNDPKFRELETIR